MDDIVEILRELVTTNNDKSERDAMSKAADEIERLRVIVDKYATLDDLIMTGKHVLKL
jgi:hypothetical protein